MGSQSETLFLEIINVQKILVGLTTFFFLAQKFGLTVKTRTNWPRKVRELILDSDPWSQGVKG